ncbi:hypothetical protein P3T43_006716 [Paraburkholderia sp. GAS41]|jgi:hypothetical protein|uniref:hypothetical protein n=1 Tax=Paraburkholderia sp. GAS41 TaxID=3035134 RepID=UPI003D22B0EE
MCAICDFKIEFGVSHPQALTVAVATREAVDAGWLPGQVFDGALSSMKMRAAAIDTLACLQARMEASVARAELVALPDFYVLLVESSTWGFFHATEDGFDPDIVPEVPDVLSEDQADRDIVLIASDTTIRGILDGDVGLERAFSQKLLVLDADAANTHAIISLLGQTLGVMRVDGSVNVDP